MTDKDQVFAKCAWRLIPFIVLLYVINYLDRVNVGFASLTMNQDLGISPTAYGYSGSLLFVGGVHITRPNSKEPDGDLAWSIVEKCVERGVLMFAPVGLGGGTVKINPPLCITREAMEEALGVFEQVCAEVLAPQEAAAR